MTPQDINEAMGEVRAELGRLPKGATLSTGELAARLVGVTVSTTERPPQCLGKAAKLLAKMALHMPADIVSHDGPWKHDAIGRPRRGWRWHGQATAPYYNKGPQEWKHEHVVVYANGDKFVVHSTCPTIAEQREKMREEGPDC